MKQTPIQKAVHRIKERMLLISEDDSSVYVARRTELYDELKYLQSLLAEERQMVEDAYERGSSDGFFGSATFPFDYFTQTYQQ